MASELPSLLSWLHAETGRRFNARTFRARLRTQKTVYLLKALGYGPARGYVFNLYLRGPYSPSLAREYYTLPGGRPPGKPLDGFTPPTPREAGLVREAVARGVEFLEAVATLHSFASHNRLTERRVLLAHLRQVKPHLEAVAEGAYEFLRAKGILPATT